MLGQHPLVSGRKLTLDGVAGSAAGATHGGVVAHVGVERDGAAAGFPVSIATLYSRERHCERDMARETTERDTSCKDTW